MKIKYKNYELVMTEDGNVDYILLNGNEVGVDECPEAVQKHFVENLESAIEWIEEDIKCREEEENIVEYYLVAGEEAYCNSVDVILCKNNVFCFNGYRDDSDFFFQGHIVEFDDDGKPYIEISNI